MMFWTLVSIGVFAIVVATVIGIALFMARQTRNFD
jgi:hypothetical protein